MSTLLLGAGEMSQIALLALLFAADKAQSVPGSPGMKHFPFPSSW